MRKAILEIVKFAAGVIAVAVLVAATLAGLIALAATVATVGGL